jgi:phosphate transport system protein
MRLFNDILFCLWESIMVRDTFQQELRRIRDEVLLLGSTVENAIVESVEILKRRDHAAAKALRKADRLINEKRYEIEANALALIATQQPMAGDMRVLAAVLDISTELERLGDYAKGIAKVSLKIGDDPLIKPLIDIPAMADKVVNMLHQALDAFARDDVELAHAVPTLDVEVDALYNQIYRELVTYIMGDPSVIEQANNLLWAAHNLERAADRANNICERTIYMVTGEMVEITSKGVKEYN